ncbi:hypothetical protein [Pedobacter faecalis]|uniref:hypothetical protein n=1 Tax=Pedobacter faecalis TaxID=3041495 RepID=UPI00254C2711|nr:hypothetical protein [Pedobacter sp. ELA7]
MKFPVKPALAVLILFAACLFACTQSATPDEAGFENSVLKPFSDTLHADTFKVRIVGDSPKDMKIAFQISAYTGKVIYAVDIKASDLFSNYDATINLDKKKNQLRFLREEAKNFLHDENFMEPAVTGEEEPDEHVPDKAFFEELRKTAFNGFSYRLGKEKKIYIAWSAKEHKVKPYYVCCE